MYRVNQFINYTRSQNIIQNIWNIQIHENRRRPLRRTPEKTVHKEHHLHHQGQALHPRLLGLARKLLWLSHSLQAQIIPLLSHHRSIDLQNHVRHGTLLQFQSACQVPRRSEGHRLLDTHFSHFYQNYYRPLVEARADGSQETCGKDILGSK